MKRIFFVLLFVCTSNSPAEEWHYQATNRWQFRIGLRNQSTPAQSLDGVVYVTSWDGHLHAINSDGSARWVFRFGTETVSSPAIGADGTIYFGSRNRRLFAIDANGNKRWDFKTDGWVDASPAIGVDGTIYCGSFDKKFYALSPDGKLKWSFATKGAIASSAVIDSGGCIYFGSNDRKFYALNPDGTKSWEFVTGGAIISSPALGREGEIYFSSVDGKLYALNSDGSLRWASQTGGISSASPVLDGDGTIYLSVNTNHCAISATGQLLWKRGFWNLTRPDSFGESAAAVLADDSVVFTGRDGFVMTVPKDRGDVDWIWCYWLYGASYSSPLVGPDGTVYAMGTGWDLNALQRNVPMAKSPWPTARGNSQRTGRATPAS